MSPVRRWKRLISPHGVFQVPKSVVSLSDAADNDCRSCSAEVLVAMYSSTERPDFFASPAACRRTSSPQKTASDVGTEETLQRRFHVRSNSICSVSLDLGGAVAGVGSKAGARDGTVFSTV